MSYQCTEHRSYQSGPSKQVRRTAPREYSLTFDLPMCYQCNTVAFLRDVLAYDKDRRPRTFPRRADTSLPYSARGLNKQGECDHAKQGSVQKARQSRKRVPSLQPVDEHNRNRTRSFVSNAGRISGKTANTGELADKRSSLLQTLWHTCRVHGALHQRRSDS